MIADIPWAVILFRIFIRWRIIRGISARKDIRKERSGDTAACISNPTFIYLYCLLFVV